MSAEGWALVHIPCLVEGSNPDSILLRSNTVGSVSSTESRQEPQTAFQVDTQSPFVNSPITLGTSLLFWVSVSAWYVGMSPCITGVL